MRLLEQATKQAESGMPRGGIRSTSFKPGVSGNPGGRPKKPRTIEARRIEADAKALARQRAPEAIQALANIMNDAKAPPAARVSAATVILDRAYGKPRQEVEISRKPDLSRLSDEQLETLVQLYTLALPSEETAH